MKIAILNNSDIHGGAARAAYRLHRALVNSSNNSRMVVKKKTSDDPTVIQTIPIRSNDQLSKEFYFNTIQSYYIDKNRTNLSNTIFSLPYPGYDLSESHILRDAEIINLHWIAHYQSIGTINKLLHMGKPVVWTLHDEWAFTGGCHYSAGCKKYVTDCSNCPQLLDDPLNLPYAVLKDKIELFKDTNLTIVAPSRWLAECAKKSSLFKRLRVETIPNSLETNIFYPVSKIEAKKRIGTPPDSLTILCGAESGAEKRKGFIELFKALQICLQDPEFNRLIKNGKVNVLCFGNPNEQLLSLGIHIVTLGYIRSDNKMRDAYNAADIFVLPSLEDNLPNTMLESMSCGTPVVAFNSGGMPDMIIDDVTGRLAPSGNFQELGKAILDIIFKSELLKTMSINCRQMIEKSYSLDTQAKNYLELFYELIESNKKTSHNYNSISNETNFQKDIVVNLETTIGDNFQNIYTGIMDKISKEVSPLKLTAHRLLQTNNILIFFTLKSKPAIRSMLSLWHLIKWNIKRYILRG